jgi:DNA processing protein
LAVVSGLAKGIDTAAHNAALRGPGKTTAVLGNGLDYIYPRENEKLQKLVGSLGALVSEFPLTLRPDYGSFPRRNRIISGLSLATVVVEADYKSGALITAKFALQQGKEVFAVPGSIYSKVSNGTNFLIKNGACPADSARTVMESLGYEAAPLAEKSAETPAAGLKVVDVLRDNLQGVSIDKLITSLGAAPGELAKELLDLELRGVIKSLPGKIYTLNR